MRRALIDYVGTVRGLQSHMAAAMNPDKVIDLAAYRQKKNRARRPIPKFVA